MIQTCCTSCVQSLNLTVQQVNLTAWFVTTRWQNVPGWPNVPQHRLLSSCDLFSHHWPCLDFSRKRFLPSTRLGSQQCWYSATMLLHHAGFNNRNSFQWGFSDVLCTGPVMKSKPMLSFAISLCRQAASQWHKLSLSGQPCWITLTAQRLQSAVFRSFSCTNWSVPTSGADCQRHCSVSYVTCIQETGTGATGRGAQQSWCIGAWPSSTLRPLMLHPWHLQLWCHTCDTSGTQS